MPTLQNSSEILRKERFPKWMNVSRISQILVTLAILGLDGFVINFWNTDKFGLNSILNDAVHVNTFLSDSPFTGLVMFSGLFTLCTLPYNLIVPSTAPIFYHVYCEIILEFFILVFWVASFAGIASYVSELGSISGSIEDTANGQPGSDLLYLAGDLQTAQNCYIAIACLGALLFAITLANLLFMMAFVVQKVEGAYHRATGENVINSSPMGLAHEAELAVEARPKDGMHIQSMPHGFSRSDVP